MFLDLEILLKKIDLHKFIISTYFDFGIRSEYVIHYLNSLMSICEQLISDLFLIDFHEPRTAIDAIERFIKNCNNKVDSISGLNLVLNDLNRVAHVISQNKYLYKIENGSVLFHETNVAGIYKELLSASNLKSDIYFTQEEINGNGRTDIQIKYKNETIGIVEVKLLKPGEENRTEAIRKGLDQLYERYFQNHYRRIDNHIILQLVLFCYDPNMETLEKSVLNAIDEHKKRTYIELSVFDSPRKNVIRLKLSENSNVLKTRVEHIDIVMIKLETKYNRDRLAKKGFKIK